MRAVWLEVPASFLDERRRLGHDKKDELWDGELHMVPPPTSRHVRVAFRLMVALEPMALKRGLEVFPEPGGLYGPGQDWRVPDGMLVRPEQVTDRGVDRAELVIEVLSPHDESRNKLPFYARIGVTEVWLIEPATRAIEVLTLTAGSYRAVAVSGGGLVSPLLGIRLEVVAGPKLRLYDGEAFTEI